MLISNINTNHCVVFVYSVIPAKMGIHFNDFLRLISTRMGMTEKDMYLDYLIDFAGP
jgi:hypothetical protein